MDASCRRLVRRLGEAGWLKAVVPQAYGGLTSSFDVRTLCLARETLAAHEGLAYFAFAMQGLGTGPITLFGSEALKDRYLPPVARGDAIAAFALSEPEAGSDVAAMSTTLEIVRIPVLNDNYVWLMREPQSGAVGVIDPAVAGPVLAEAARRRWKITHILNTHHHGDHVGGNREIKEATGCTVVGMRRDRARIPGIDVEVDDGDRYRFGEAEAEISKLETHVFPKLKQLLARYRPDWRALDDTGGGTNPADLPLLSALSKVVALDLGEPWWKHWWTRDRNFEGQVTELDGLIRREFYPIVDELAQAARAHLKARQANSLQEANLVFVGLVELLKEQSRARLERTRALITGETTHNPELQRTRDARTTELKSQITKMDLLVRRLESIEEAWAEKIG